MINAAPHLAEQHFCIIYENCYRTEWGCCKIDDYSSILQQPQRNYKIYLHDFYVYTHDQNTPMEDMSFF